jgi:hypothetical protein
MTVTKQQCKTFETPKTVTESKEECVDVTTDVCIKVPVPNCVTEHEKVVSEVTALYHNTACRLCSKTFLPLDLFYL